MPFIYGAKKSADFPRRNRIQSIVIVATCMFLQTSVIVRHSQSPSVLGVKAQQCLISFETAVHCRELELQLSTNDLGTSVPVLFAETIYKQSPRGVL